MAHSMGAYALRHAVQGMRKEVGDDLPRLFDEILLFAPDEDADAFEHDHKLALLPRLGRRVTVYHNREDIPLAISDLTKGNPDRLGADGPAHPHLLPAKVTVVDCTDVVTTGFQEHRYHKANNTIVNDILAALLGEPARLIKNRASFSGITQLSSIRRPLALSLHLLLLPISEIALNSKLVRVAGPQCRS